jgi:hypothetical protein
LWLLLKTRFTLSDKTIWIITGSGALCLVLIFIALYPIANIQIPGSGSDDDDAINIAVRELFSGRYPYYQLTYLGNGIHHFAGSFVIGAPFVLAGTSALQNLFWLAILAPLLLKMTGSKNEMLRFCLIIATLSPIVIQQTATGGGHLANVIYVMVGMYWLLESNNKWLPAVFWGIALASRANFLLLIPLAFFWLFKTCGLSQAVKIIATVISIVLILTLPFYLYDPSAFTPLEGANRLTRFDHILPNAGLVIGCGMAFLALALGQFQQCSYSTLWRNCALIQAFPVLIGFALGGDLKFLSYGIFFFLFGILSFAARSQEKQN